MKNTQAAIFYPEHIKADDVYVYVNQFAFEADGSVKVIDYSMRNAMRNQKDLAYLVRDEIKKGKACNNFVPLPKDEGILLGVFLPNHSSKQVALRALSQAVDKLLEFAKYHNEATYHIPLPLRWNKKVSNEEVRDVLSALPDNFIVYR